MSIASVVTRGYTGTVSAVIVRGYLGGGAPVVTAQSGVRRLALQNEISKRLQGFYVQQPTEDLAEVEALRKAIELYLNKLH